MSRPRRLLVLALGGGALLAAAALAPRIPRWIEEERCLEALDGPDWKEAAATLGRLGSERAIPELFAHLPRDHSANFRESAAGAALIGGYLWASRR